MEIRHLASKIRQLASNFRHLASLLILHRSEALLGGRILCSSGSYLEISDATWFKVGR